MIEGYIFCLPFLLVDCLIFIIRNILPSEQSSVQKVLLGYTGIPLTPMQFVIAETEFLIPIHYELLLSLFGQH